MFRYPCALKVSSGALSKIPRHFESQPIKEFSHDYSRISVVVLVGNTVVERFQNDALVVLGDFDWHQLIPRQQAHLDIANPLIQPIGADEERWIEVFKSSFRTA